MKLRTAFAVFLSILIVVSAGLHLTAKIILRSAASPEFFQMSIQQALERGETDLAGRMLAKGVYYAGDRETILKMAEGRPDLRDYLEVLAALRDGQSAKAEIYLGRVAASENTLLAARAKIRLEEMRYGAGLPNAERIPF